MAIDKNKNITTNSINDKQKYEIENTILKKEINKLDRKVLNLEELISIEPTERLVFLDMQENERKRLARDLHDSPLQNLTHLIHKLELSSLYIDQDTTRAKLELAEVSTKIKSVIEDIRDIIYDLRPMEFDDLGFSDALKGLITKMQSQTDISIDLICENEISIKNDLILTNIYRIIKECITNSIKHSKASKINIKLYEEYDRQNLCHININDNGIGMEKFLLCERKNHFGLHIVDERVQLLKGELDIQSPVFDSCGTLIRITVPFDGE